MTEIIGIAIFIIIIIMVLILVLPQMGWGKWWHKHDWYVADSTWVPSMTYQNYEDLYTVKKCYDCSALKVIITEGRYK